MNIYLTMFYAHQTRNLSLGSRGIPPSAGCHKDECLNLDQGGTTYNKKGVTKRCNKV